MKKKLFLLSFFSPILLFPMVLVSCSQNNNQDRIDQAWEKINQIIKEKPLPTLKNLPPETGDINLEDYDINSFNDIETDVEGIEISIDSIEIPTLNSKNLVIWIEVISTDTTDIIAEISDFYSINLSEISGIDETRIQPISKEIISNRFNNLMESKKSFLLKFINDAIYGTGFFDGEKALNPQDLNNDPKDLNDRLATKNINAVIFENHQSNIYGEFIEFYETSNQLKILFELREEDAVDNDDRIIWQSDFDLNIGGNL